MAVDTAVEELLARPLSALPGISAGGARTLSSALDLETWRDLLEHYPRQDGYRELAAAIPLADAEVGSPLTVVGTISGWNVIRTKKRVGNRHLTIAKATIAAETGGSVEAPFFNQDWRQRATPRGSRVAVTGVLERYRKQLQLKSPRLVQLGADDAGPGPGGLLPDDDEAQDDDTGYDGIVVAYPATERFASRRIAAAVRELLDLLPELPDHLPPAVRGRLLPLDEALRTLHRPASLDALPAARARLIFDELFTLQLGLQQRRARLEADAVGLDNAPAPGGLAERLVERLPFRPTSAQRRAFGELGYDLGQQRPMHRLLQGDVGAGKTVVAAWTACCAIEHGRQAVLLAPTEVLAEQHQRTLEALLAPLGVNAPGGPRVELLTGSTTTRRRRGLLARLLAGDVDLVIGTHALLEPVVQFADLGLVVVDEQHRFGVEHRARLSEKRDDGRTPDVLVMTATPIPRSLALTVYGDLDVTALDELPPGRQPVRTTVLPSGSPRRERLYAFVRERVAAGERCYVVTPLVEASEKLEELASAEEVHARLAAGPFAGLGVGLVHGRLTASERDAVMDDFRTGAVQVLVATTVIEVGVDVAEATVMIIEDADRFGISQLHQLRGRVGRSSGQSWCVLFSSVAEASERLTALAETTDGFELAEVDLRLRGEGSLFDTRQSGLPDLKLAQLSRDLDVVVATRKAARQLLRADPSLERHPALAAEVARRYGAERLEALRTG